MDSTTSPARAHPDPLPRAAPATLGVSSAGILAFIDEVNERVGGLHGMMLLCRGKVVAETWWAPYHAGRPHYLWSLSKSFTSTAVGLAVSEGLLSVDDKVISFFPDALPAKIDEHLAAMRVRDLLSMSTGHDTEPPLGGDDDWARAFLSHEVRHEPGTHFLYNTPATFMLSSIVQQLTGQRISRYLTPRLFEPLGIDDPHWEQSPLGFDIGGYGLSLKLEDVARFGLLYLQKGLWNGRQLIPAAWIEAATSAQVSNGDPATSDDWKQGYGYQFWRSRHNAYRADGAFGQYCVVLPEHESVLAINANVVDMPRILDIAWRHVLPALTGGGEQRPIPPQSVPAPAGSATSPTAQRISGDTWIMDANEEGIRAVRLTFEPDRCLLDVFVEGRRFTLPVGLDRWLEGVHFVEGAPRPIASRGAWEDASTFGMKICFTERPDDWSQTFRFDGETLTIARRQVRFGFSGTERPDLTAKRASVQ